MSLLASSGSYHLLINFSEFTKVSNNYLFEEEKTKMTPISFQNTSFGSKCLSKLFHDLLVEPPMNLGSNKK